MRKLHFLPLLFLFISPLNAITLMILNVDQGNNNIEIYFDLSNATDFPPQHYPKCYFPTQGTSSNPNGVGISIILISLGRPSISNAYLAVRASNNPSSSVTADQLYWTTISTPLPPEGTEPQPPWTPFSLTWENVDVIPVTRGTVRRDYNMDICFKLEGDDDPTPQAGITTSIYIRFYGL